MPILQSDFCINIPASFVPSGVFLFYVDDLSKHFPLSFTAAHIRKTEEAKDANGYGIYLIKYAQLIQMAARIGKGF